ncbi:MAG: molybdenum cofactor guanylyltransferase [Dehalococcoidia bacterium]|jgi:molybdopterin-guanine dinucleotide biosynthesis protein A|nr:molybdenum cofactor guanylyltransferase [Dehalococcoidia bacterium]
MPVIYFFQPSFGNPFSDETMQENPGSFHASGIVLAGGRSQRLGRDKALETIGGQPLVRRVIDRISQVTEEVVVVVAEQSQADALPLEEGHRVALDRYPGGGALGGIFTGLAAAQHQWGIAVACDMPFLNLDLLRRMLYLRQGADAVVPMLRGWPEPTHAIYSKACLPFMEQRLLAGDPKIARFFDKVRVAYLPEEEIAALDPDFLSFLNVNTPQDLAKARELEG